MATADADDPAGWLSTAAAARLMGVTPRTLHRFIEQGDLAAQRFGDVVRLHAADVHDFIRDRRIDPGTLP